MYHLWSMLLVLFMIFISIRYLKAARQHNKEVEKWRKVSFFTGVVLFLAAQTSPMLTLGHASFIAHMLQQTITYFVVPVFILLGMTEGLLQPFYKHPVANKVLKIFTNPKVSLPVFILLFSSYYLPFIFNAVMSHFLFQLFATVLLLPFAFFEWWSIISLDKPYYVLSPFQKIVYVIGLGLFFSPLGFYLIFSGDALYDAYAFWDQQAGGTIWKVSTVLIYILVIGQLLSEAVKLDRQDMSDAAGYVRYDK